MKIPALQKQYDGRMVLDTPELTLEKGKLYALLGANGSGKSTFARILAGIISSDNHRRLPENCRVGYLPQKGYAFRTTVLKNILLGNGDEKKAQELIRDFSLEDLKRQQARSLSGGEIQRMCLARILMKTYDLRHGPEVHSPLGGDSGRAQRRGRYHPSDHPFRAAGIPPGR